jgi:hypothetical protein
MICRKSEKEISIHPTHVEKVRRKFRSIQRMMRWRDEEKSVIADIGVSATYRTYALQMQNSTCPRSVSLEHDCTYRQLIFAAVRPQKKGHCRKVAGCGWLGMAGLFFAIPIFRIHNNIDDTHYFNHTPYRSTSEYFNNREMAGLIPSSNDSQ